MLNREDLHGYQLRGVDMIIKHTGVALFLDAGMGKTATTLTAISDLLDAIEVRKVLVVAPNKVVKLGTWQNEIKNWAHVNHLTYSVAAGVGPEKRKQAVSADVDIVLVNWENVVWLIKTFGRKWPFDMIVLDESSKTKNPTSKTFRALKKIRNETHRMALLTGSPAANSLLNLWSQMYLVDFGERLYRTYSAFRDTYFESDYMGYKFTLRDGSEKKIHDRMSDVVLTMRASDYLDMPEVVDVVHNLELSPKLREQYTEFEREQILALIDDSEEDVITAVNAAVLSNKLLQFTSGALYINEEKDYKVFHDIKLDELSDIIEEANGQPILLAYYYKHEIERICKRFPEVVVLDNNPETLARWNRREIKVLAANPASAGHGLNAQKGGNILVWYSYPNWDLELYEQFTARLARQGQEASTVVAHHLIVEGTNDIRVLNSLKEKDGQQRRLFQALGERVKEVLSTVA